MTICRICKRDLPVDQFYAHVAGSGSRRQTECKHCARARIRCIMRCRRKSRASVRVGARGHHGPSIKAALQAYKMANPCKCGESRWFVLCFHHRDPATKSFNVAASPALNVSLAQLQDEFDKCDVLCANCHMAFHHGQPRAPGRPRRSRPPTACPSIATLLELVATVPAQVIGRMYGVSGGAVRKWCLTRGIVPKPRGFWSHPPSP